MRFALRPAPILALLLLAACHARADSQIITLHFADAREVAEALNGLIEPGSSVRVYRNQLVLSAGSAHLAELRGIIALLDEAPRQLLISIKSPQARSHQSHRTRIDQHRETPWTSRTGTTITQTRIRTSTLSRGPGSTSPASHSIRAMEGREAYIRKTAVATVGGTRNHVVSLNEDQGFWVKARVNKDSVTLSIRSRHASGAGARRQDIDTRISGRLGQWIAVGSITREAQHDSRSNTGFAGRQHHNTDTVYLKVELIPEQ